MSSNPSNGMILGPGSRAAVIRLARFLGFVAASLGFFEIAFGVYFAILNHRFVAVATLLEEEQNTFIRAVKGHRDCTYLDTLFPHPYLAFVHHGNPPCGIPINNVGLYGPDFPLERDPQHFTILLTGGSVAAQLGGCCRIGKQDYLEEALNARFEPPRGSAFRVLNGADGAWKQPQQTILLLQHAPSIDAVVTLDGVNEHGSLKMHARLELPATNFVQVNPMLETGPRRLLGVWLVGGIYRFQGRHWLTSHSFVAYGFIRTVREMVRAYSEREPATERRTSIVSLFGVPAGWTAEASFDWNLERYRAYVRAMDAIAGQAGLRAAHFIQPVPAIGKTLTPEEQRVVGDLAYRPSYLRMTAGLLQLRAEGIPMFSLLSIFEGVKEQVYADTVHCWADQIGESPGYRLMAERMTEHLGEQWHLKAKPRNRH